jgi:ribosomal protein S18 acetylase RimI-like enzyme
MTIVRRPATDRDVDYIYALREAAYRERVEALFGPWLEPQQREFLANDMAETPYQIVVDDDVDVGSIAVAHHADHDFLDDIMIAPEHRDRGIGTQVMRMLMDEARTRGVPLRLSGARWQSRPRALRATWLSRHARRAAADEVRMAVISNAVFQISRVA